jgi:hypothetical protein
MSLLVASALALSASGVLTGGGEQCALASKSNGANIR